MNWLGVNDVDRRLLGLLEWLHFEDGLVTTNHLLGYKFNLLTMYSMNKINVLKK